MESTLTCPKCGHQQKGEIPEGACAFFYECEGCHERIHPKEGDCCVFCSYGDQLCPSSPKKR